ncbi:hypothetical protein [Mucilaginibacter jinjuensis]|uniref:Outer membrane protein beta-barrel domain-containing protein n=1 Tax=Mucilaginibacter jinjuensis TaxID=1176721 RepID=A0ABY7TCM7_9SPHI|nr:hypothetical protein [Mucilaginibacter jinjuensis]WCT13825.1 hypothetical protein PQO05_07760 [Mucilaginibacter jinjuensis]
MKKYLPLVITIALSVFLNKAQAQYYNNTYREDSWHVTIGPDIMGVINPTQQVDFTNPTTGKVAPNYVTYSRLSAGGSVHAEYYPNPFVGLTIGVGADFIPGTKNAKSLVLVPITIGAKAFFSQTMYLGAEAGLGYSSISYKGSRMTKLVSPALGYNNNDNGLDISLRYEVMHGSNQYLSMIGLHIAYSFDLSPSY